MGSSQFDCIEIWLNSISCRKLDAKAYYTKHAHQVKLQSIHLFLQFTIFRRILLLIVHNETVLSVRLRPRSSQDPHTPLFSGPRCGCSTSCVASFAVRSGAAPSSSPFAFSRIDPFPGGGDVWTASRGASRDDGDFDSTDRRTSDDSGTDRTPPRLPQRTRREDPSSTKEKST